ncbi:hypothetical protein AAVH_14277 [Aphelenchoides avenae]|nr:hypothetical protein AAVH_14277 [Aphelenchus avenae]
MIFVGISEHRTIEKLQAYLAMSTGPVGPYDADEHGYYRPTRCGSGLLNASDRKVSRQSKKSMQSARQASMRSVPSRKTTATTVAMEQNDTSIYSEPLTRSRSPSPLRSRLPGLIGYVVLAVAVLLAFAYFTYRLYSSSISLAEP